MKLVYDESVTVSYGMFVCPECDSGFYGGGRAIHNQGCKVQGYKGVNFHFGPSQIIEVFLRAASVRPDSMWYGISLNMLKEQFSECFTEHGTVTGNALSFIEAIRLKAITDKQNSIEYQKQIEKQAIVDMMCSSKNEVEWIANCDKVKSVCDGYPQWWTNTIVASELADEMKTKFQSNKVE